MPTASERLNARRANEIAKTSSVARDLEGFIDIGAFISGDLLPAPIERIAGRILAPISLFLRQSVNFGSTGSGKTEFLKWITYQTLKNTDYDVIIVDGKGEPELAQSLAVVAHELGLPPIPKVDPNVKTVRG